MSGTTRTTRSSHATHTVRTRWLAQLLRFYWFDRERSLNQQLVSLQVGAFDMEITSYVIQVENTMSFVKANLGQWVGS
ncbi:hypothetical protein BJX96DRAFT_160063, partial [Aspergillus floccosus]